MNANERELKTTSLSFKASTGIGVYRHRRFPAAKNRVHYIEDVMFKILSFLLIACGIFCGAAAAQPISAGLKAGVPLTDALTAAQQPSVIDAGTSLQQPGSGYSADTHRYVIGPYIDIHLPASFAIEVDALYRSYNFTLNSPYASATTSVSSWDFPVMLKYKMLHGPLRPYIEGGLVFNHLSVSDVPELIHRSTGGVTLGAGLEIHALRLRISPEIRYEGFLLHNISSPGDLLQSNRNQVLFMVGIGF
jgi:hypothetical protein